MSAQPPVPISAPWQSEWNQYPIQFFPFEIAGPVCRVTVPDGQWYRPIWANVVVTTSAAAGNRSILFVLGAAGAVSNLVVASTVTYGPSLTINGAAFPYGSPYSVSVDATQRVCVTQYPEMIWPPASIFAWQIGNVQAGDAFTAGEAWLAAEIYTERYNDAGPPILVPTPTLV